MYDDLSNLKDKFQEDGFTFQEFSNETLQHIDNKKEIASENKKNNTGSTKSNNKSSNQVIANTLPPIKEKAKQPVNKSISLSYEQGNQIKSNKDNQNKTKSNLSPNYQIFDNKKTDKTHANENISLKDVFSFIGSVSK